MNIGDWTTKRAMLQPDSTIVISDNGRACTYEEFNRRVNRLANALPGEGKRCQGCSARSRIPAPPLAVGRAGRPDHQLH